MTAHAALAAHMRLAALPKWGRAAAPADDFAKRQEAAEKAHRTRLANAGSRPNVRPGKLPPSIVAMGNKPKGRAPVGRHGFALGDAVEIVGGRYAGEVGRYDGSVDRTRCFVQTKGGRRSVAAKFVRRIA